MSEQRIELKPPHEIDFSFEYCQARKLMGNKNTDLEKLSESIAYLVLYAPVKFQRAFEALAIELEKRIMFSKIGAIS